MSRWLERAAVARTHVLLVEAGDGWLSRCEVETQVVRRGWRLATAPADADLLVVCGAPGPALTQAAELVWQQLPGPRARVAVADPAEAGESLDRGRAQLLDTAWQRADARSRPGAADLIAAAASAGETPAGEHGGHEGHDMGGHDMGGHGGHDMGGHGGHDMGGHGGHDMGGHGGHDMGGHDMGHGGHAGHEGHGDMDMSPDGIPLASGGEDRDGLEMDVLRVRLGPVLPSWPAGLVLSCDLQGDVITSAEATVLEPATWATHDPTLTTARRCDRVASLLALAGPADAAGLARDLRDALLRRRETAVADEDLAATARRLERRVSRSRLLRWSLRDLRPVGPHDLDRQRLPEQLAGDTHQRLVAMCQRITSAVSHGSQPPDQIVALERLPWWVTGLDVATARLVIASLDTPAFVSEHAHHGSSHG